MSIENALKEVFITDAKRKGHYDESYVTFIVKPDDLIPQIIQAFIDEGWRVPQKPLDQKKAEELLEKLYWNTK